MESFFFTSFSPSTHSVTKISSDWEKKLCKTELPERQQQHFIDSFDQWIILLISKKIGLIDNDLFWLAKALFYRIIKKHCLLFTTKARSRKTFFDPKKNCFRSMCSINTIKYFFGILIIVGPYEKNLQICFLKVILFRKWKIN